MNLALFIQTTGAEAACSDNDEVCVRWRDLAPNVVAPAMSPAVWVQTAGVGTSRRGGGKARNVGCTQGGIGAKVVD